MNTVSPHSAAPEISSLTVTDPQFVKKDSLNAFERFFMNYIKDERDLPFIYLCLKIILIIIPFAVVLFIPGVFRWWLAGIYFAINLGFILPSFILMLHNTSHRKLFKVKYKKWNNFIPWIIGPFFGESPETYFSHHVGMHHPENNMEEDLSSTLQYQRDSFMGFMHYFLSFFFFGLVALGRYLTRKKRPKLLNRMLVGELSFIALCVVLCFVNLQATLAVFIIPVVVVRFLMMAGNWGQHAFVDAKTPDNCFRNSITCINSSYNHKAFNDGYHIGHHFYPTMHWTDMPGEFIKNQAKYAAEGAIVFEKLDFFAVWLFLMLGRYNWLAKYYVNLEASPKSKEEIIALLKERVKPIG